MTSIVVLSQYANIVDISFPDFIANLPKYNRINKYSINLFEY